MDIGSLDIFLRIYISKGQGDQKWMVRDVGLKECLFCFRQEYIDYV